MILIYLHCSKISHFTTGVRISFLEKKKKEIKNEIFNY